MTIATEAVIVQWIRTTWTKESRGGPGATLRNAAPAGFVLPPLPVGSAHVVAMHERDGFAPHGGVHEAAWLNVSLREEAGSLRVHPRDNPMYEIPPRRRRPPAVRLREGEWLRWLLNYRFSSATGRGDWLYWLDTFNVAYGKVGREVFLGTPDRLIDERSSLR